MELSHGSMIDDQPWFVMVLKWCVVDPAVKVVTVIIDIIVTIMVDQ